jgi:hypothetical protein
MTVIPVNILTWLFSCRLIQFYIWKCQAQSIKEMFLMAMVRIHQRLTRI